MKANLAQLKEHVTFKSQSILKQVRNSDVQFDGVVIDSRKVTPECLFVAIKGDNHDAHDFLNDVLARGAAAVVAQRVPQQFALPTLLVPDSRVALGEIGKFWRSQFTLPVIGVTGSNGKTTVKEMISSILAASFGVEFYLATQGNLNNDIGVPQTLMRLTEQHRAAVVELGMNHPGEIAKLAAIAMPTVGLVNNAQREHQEFMETVEAVAQENGAVLLSLPDDGVAVFPADDVYTDLWRELAGSRPVVTFGLTDACDVAATYEPTEFGNVLHVKIADQIIEIQLSAAGLHNVRNALAAIAACHAIGCTGKAIVAGLQNFKPVSGRLQKKLAPNSATVIDDTYNANPDSVRAAIDVLAQASGKKILVLGDMGEVGKSGPLFHAEIGAYAKERGIDILYTLGSLASHSTESFGDGAQHFGKIETLMKNLDANVTASSTVLVKGSRFMKMERVVAHLLHVS